MLLETLTNNLAKVFGTDVTDTSFASIIPTITEPVASSTRGIIANGGGRGGDKGQNLVKLYPIGTGANNAVITGMRVIGWNKFPGDPIAATPTADLWIPEPLAAFDLVYGNVTGVAATGGKAAGALTSTYFFMDTVNQTTNFGDDNVNIRFSSNQSDLVAGILVDLEGCAKFEVIFDAGANVTAMNCLYRFL